MRAIKSVFFLLSMMCLANCAFPGVTPEGSRVRAVNKSPCTPVGSFQMFRHDQEMALNYKSFKKQEDVYAINQARDKASKMGGNQVVEVFSYQDHPTHMIISFYSVHKCKSSSPVSQQ